MSLRTVFYNSFYINTGRDSFYLKCFETERWLRCKTEFEITSDNSISRIQLDSSNFDVTEIASPQTQTKRVNPFDHPRTIIQFEQAEMLLRYLLKEIKEKWWASTHTMIFHLNYMPEGGIVDIELRALHDLCLHAGAKEAHIVNPAAAVSERELETFVRKNHQIKFFGKQRNPEWESLFL